MKKHRFYLYFLMLNIFSQNIFSQNSVFNLKNQLIEPVCNDYIPRKLSLKNNTSLIIINNNVSSKKSLLNIEKNTLLKLQIEDTTLENIYKLHFKDEYKLALEKYNFLCKANSKVKPEYTSLICINNEESVGIAITYNLKIENNDSSAEKLYTLVFLNNNIVTSMYKLNYSNTDYYNFNEYEMFVYENKLYVQCSQTNRTSNKQKFEILAEFIKNGNDEYKFNKFCESKLPEINRINKHFYNYTNMFFDKNYYTFLLSDKIYDVNSSKSISIPFERGVYTGIHFSGKPYKMELALWDLKYDQLSEYFIVLYNNEGNYYVSRFKKNDVSFKQTIKWESIYNTADNAPTISSDGKFLIFKEVNKSCIKFEKLVWKN